MAPWTPVTFDALWRDAVANRADRLFLRFEDRDEGVHEWTYGDFDGVVEAAAATLIAAGAGPGAAVHLALTNSPTFVAAWLAAIRVGAWIVPSDPFATPSELAEHLARTRPAIGFCATARRDTYRAAGDVLPATVVDVDESDAEMAWAGADRSPGPRRPGLRDRAAVMFTSGTTGRPKGVEVTQANYAFAGQTMAAACDLTAADRQLVVLPLFHANAQYYSFAAAIAAGASVALMPSFSASRFLRQATAHAATCASLFAGPIRMILARSDPPNERGPLRHCWFAQNLSEEQYATISAWLGCRPRQLYGMTETIPAVLTDQREDPRCDTMGYVTPGCAVDLDGGELVVGGEPGITLFAGYLDDPATDSASFRDGWFLTGDRATRDEHGRYRFAGRRSDVLKVAGENVSTVEVEQVLGAHPSVADVAVVGAPDPVRDEVPVAVVVPATGVEPDDALRGVLAAWCAERLGRAKRPREFRFVAELPRTSVGKIKKYELLRSPATQAGAPSPSAGAPVAYSLDRQDARWRSLNSGHGGGDT